MKRLLARIPFAVRTETIYAVLFLLGLTLFMMGDLVFAPHPPLISMAGCDTQNQYLPMRTFCFNEMRRGHVPQWNPLILSGTPYLANVETAMFYPFNAVFLVLSPVRAVNVIYALHLFLAALFMFLWLTNKRFGALPSLAASVLLVLTTDFFPRIFAGYMTYLCTVTWVPLLLLAADKTVERPTLPWFLIGTGAAALQMVSGHVQYAYYTALVLALYISLRAFGTTTLGRSLGLLGLMYGSAGLLAAVQLLPTLRIMDETVRSNTSYAFATMFSFPPENIVTLLAPGFFGDIVHFPYWGECLWWKSTMFISITGLVFFVYGAFCGDLPEKKAVLLLAGLLLLCALGRYTPVYRLLYAAVPYFSLFRGSAKFIFFVSLFMLLVAAAGFDAFLKNGAKARHAALLTGTLALALLYFAFSLSNVASGGTDQDAWHRFARHLFATGELHYPSSGIPGPEFVARAAGFASRCLAGAAGVAIVLAVLLFLRKRTVTAAYLVLVLAVLEAVSFARPLRVTSPSHDPNVDVAANVLKNNPGDYRIFQPNLPGSALLAGAHNIFCGASNMLRRYMEFMALTQRLPPDKARIDLPLSRVDRLFRMLRLRFVIHNGRVIELPDPLPRALLLRDWEVLPGCDALLAHMYRPDFDPAREVLLEQVPDPLPGPGAPGDSVRVTDVTTDKVLVEASLASPAVLLLTDVYTTGWRVRPLSVNTQRSYSVIPANYILQGIPLSAGHHRFEIVYEAPGYLTGKWISLTALLFFAGLGAWWLFRLPRHR